MQSTALSDMYTTIHNSPDLASVKLTADMSGCFYLEGAMRRTKPSIIDPYNDQRRPAWIDIGLLGMLLIIITAGLIMLVLKLLF